MVPAGLEHAMMLAWGWGAAGWGWGNTQLKIIVNL